MKREDWQEITTWINVGWWQGAKQGTVLAFYYTLIAPLIYILAFNHPQSWGMMINLWALMSGFGMIMGVVPAIVLGAISGALLGMVLWMPHLADRRKNRLIIGMGIAFITIHGMNQISGSLFPNSLYPDWKNYLFHMRVPPLFYLGACAWLIYDLPRLVEQHYQKHERPVLPVELKETRKGG
jgi:hypothetical protein